MRKVAAMLIFLMCTLSLQPIIADEVEPNKADQSPNGNIEISVDGFVTTKFTSVGDMIEIFAHTKGHSGGLLDTTTIVTADIHHYPDNDPIGIITQGDLPQNPVLIDNVVLQPQSLHDNDSSIMIWEGHYTIPLNSLGGVYGASITMEEAGLAATDNPTQIPDKFISEIEQVLQTIDNTWDTANPTMEIKAVFDNLNSSGADNGGWVQFVDDASRQPGFGESSQLWNNMISAGYNNPSYDMSNGSQFLEALMEFLESSDLEAGMAFLTGLFVYADEFPLPTSLNEFDVVADYLNTFDPVENFTRFSGTEEFSVAYDAMLGSNEWQNLRDALDNLANNTMIFESFQTLLHNMALLSVSNHPDALSDGFAAWIEPLLDGDYDSMTPFQKLLASWLMMSVTFVDPDGNGIPEEVIWEYELLLNTSEGLQWQALMETSYSYVADGFEDFNKFDVDLFTIFNETREDPAWGDASNAIAEFSSWANNASMSQNFEWEYEGEEESEDSGDDDDDSSSEDEYQYVIFDNLHSIETSNLNKFSLDLGFELRIEGPWDTSTDYPNDFNMTVTDSQDLDTNVVLTRKSDDSREYYGRFSVDSAGEEAYTFSQPLQTYRPPCADSGCLVERAELEFVSLKPSLLDSMPLEIADEIFLVSAVGVLVEQNETTLLGQPFSVESTTYDAVNGAIAGANIDTAILRASPGLGVSAASTFSPDGDVEYSITSTDITAEYNGGDLDGDVSGTVETFTGNEERNGDEHPQSVQNVNQDWEEIDRSGMGGTWDASHSDSLPVAGGLADVATRGVTENGLEFEFIKQMPLPGTIGCATTWGNPDSLSVGIDFRYDNFKYWDEENDMEQSYDKPDLDSLTIDWGDGNQYQEDPLQMMGNGYQYHTYANSGEYPIEITFTPVTGYSPVVHTHTYVASEDDSGFRMYDEEGNPYLGELENPNWCYLQEQQQSFTPSPSIINEFITNGPFEVITQQILTSDSEGKASLSVNPPHTGAYISIVQSEIIRESDGETLTGLGFNFGIATQGSLSISGLDIIDHFAGLPVYAANTSQETQTISIEADGISSGYHKTIVSHLPLDLSIAFDDVEWDSEPETHELQFNPGEASRSVILEHSAPLSLIGIISTASDSEGESSLDDTLAPLAMHIGLIVHNPQELDLTGPLGPGLTTNIALSEEIDPATKLLAVASPTEGFDPATVDFSTITELFSNELLRPATDWIGVEENIDRICEGVDAWHHTHWNDATQSDETTLTFRIIQESDSTLYGGTPIQTDGSNAILSLKEDTGYYAPTNSYSRADGTYILEYDMNNLDVGEYEFSTMTNLGSTLELEIYDGDGDDLSVGEENFRCDGQVELTDTETFDIFDNYVTRFSTIAWGQGSSADLQLPALSSPISEYTIISVAQQGSGASATLVSAVSTILSEPNPEPPTMENLTLVFTPSNPVAGDLVLVTVTDESNNPVEGLSITLVKDDQTLSSLLSNEVGQNSFTIPEGTITIRVSGGQYYPVEITIEVDDDGDGPGLPGDRDGDGYGDILDAFPDDETEWYDTDLDNIGNNADTDDDGDGLSDDQELIAQPQTNPLNPDTDGDGYCDGTIDVDQHCAANDAFPIDSSEWLDTDGDGTGDNSDTDDDGDTWLDSEEEECNSDPLDVTSIPDDVDGDGICDVLDPDNTDGPDYVDPDNNLDSNNDTQQNSDSDASDSTSTQNMLIGGSIGLVILLIVIGLFITLRNRGDELAEKKFAKEEELFERISATASTMPTTPPITARGEMHEGYEAIEHPLGSGNWFYRDPTSGMWIEWR